ncbi:hypothetical protein [Nocardia sp. NPDC006630]
MSRILLRSKFCGRQAAQRGGRVGIGLVDPALVKGLQFLIVEELP